MLLLQQIYLSHSGVCSLKELCTSVIMSALLKQSSLEPDQLLVKLPDYVPPSVKHYLTERFSIITYRNVPQSPSRYAPSDSDSDPDLIIMTIMMISTLNSDDYYCISD